MDHSQHTVLPYQSNASSVSQFTVRNDTPLRNVEVPSVPVMNTISGNQISNNDVQFNREQSRFDPNRMHISGSDNVPLKRSSKHLIYAIEILIFTIAGWGWLAVREFMGATPVIDVSVLFCLLMSSTINLVLALIFYTTDQFKKAAQGFFAHTLSIWILYVYSLSESTSGGWDPLCCNGITTYSVTKTYASAYFGGLPLHQTAGAITVAFISVFLILAAGQLRACINDPREWLTRKVTTSLACLVSFHLGLFVLNSGACGVANMGGAVIGVAVLNWLSMTDFIPILISLIFTITDEAKELIQMISELILTVLLTAMSGVLSSKLGGRPSLALMLIFGGVGLWQAVSVGVAVFMPLNTLNNLKKRRKGQQLQPEDFAPSAPPEHALRVASQLRGLYNRPVMLIPGVGEMRLNGTHKRENKAW